MIYIYIYFFLLFFIQIEKKILDFCQTATSNDNQIITYAYRPIHREEIFQLSSFDKKPLFFEMLPTRKNSNTIKSTSSHSNNKSTLLVDTNQNNEEDNKRQSIEVISSNPYSYILRSQIFLCLATLATHRLKQVDIFSFFFYIIIIIIIV